MYVFLDSFSFDKDQVIGRTSTNKLNIITTPERPLISLLIKKKVVIMVLVIWLRNVSKVADSGWP